MARYAKEDIDRIRDAVDFVALVEGRTELRRSGVGRMVGLCPFHDERTPSFSVNVEDKLFHCFGCGEGGDLFRFVELTENVDFPEAVELLADRAGIQLRTEDEDPQAAARRKQEARLLELLDRTCRYYERQLWSAAEAGGARAELQRRGLDPELLREFRVGYAPSAFERVLTASRHAGYRPEELLAAGLVQRSRDRRDRVYDRFRRRITFPLADRRGRILGFGARALGADQKPKYVNSADGPVYHKGQHLFAAHLARKHAARVGEVILCEGYTDVIALHQAGRRNAVGLMGTALTPDQVGELRRMASVLVLALDADAAGRKAMLKAADLAAGSGLELQVAMLPDGMDPADMLVKRGAAALDQAFGRTISIGRFRVGQALEEADLQTAEGKDRAIADLRPIFATIDPGVLRMELVQDVARRLRLDPTVLGPLLDGPGGPPARRAPDPVGSSPGGAGASRAAPGSAAPRGGGPAASAPGCPAGAWEPALPPAPSASTGTEDPAEAELRFLASCRAAGTEAASLLGDDRLAELFAHEPHRQAAAALREWLRAGTPPATDDPLMAGVLRRLVALAQQVEHPSVARAELDGLQLEFAAVSRRLPRAGAESPALQVRRQALRVRIEELVATLARSARKG
ncbi:DNA primase [Patulibacter brassicae]|uniref:DNA primase n=1 Tax=Patulibacter brassicae TaxID=1705717 RepID=A0ABU4VDX1_9ACTN|nr:DNA primase [Patulibacter brassicae]MDX8149991.1 DNA primase [Patulibacter brassicae]